MNFINLPKEIIILILDNLNFQDIINLKLTNKYNNNILNNKQIEFFIRRKLLKKCYNKFNTSLYKESIISKESTNLIFNTYYKREFIAYIYQTINIDIINSLIISGKNITKIIISIGGNIIYRKVCQKNFITISFYEQGIFRFLHYLKEFKIQVNADKCNYIIVNHIQLSNSFKNKLMKFNKNNIMEIKYSFYPVIIKYYHGFIGVVSNIIN